MEKIELDKKKLGRGSNGTSVFEGRFEELKAVAVKRMLKDDVEIDGEIIEKEGNEVKYLRKFEHFNVIRYFLELCDGILVDCIEDNKIYIRKLLF